MLRRTPLLDVVLLACTLVAQSALPPVALAEAAEPPPPRPQGPTSGQGSTPTPAAAQDPNAAAQRESLVARILSGIWRVGPGVAALSRESRDLILSNLATLLRSARAVPANLNGTRGYRLHGIRRGSILAALGLANGDLLKSINGRPTTTPQEALAAFSGLRSAGSWTLQVTRRGNDVTLSVRVVDGAPAEVTPRTPRRRARRPSR